jgi:exopolyphosphatase/guanosine-5'-triphosphate,3'-diphosphate pyrophosphatase
MSRNIMSKSTRGSWLAFAVVSLMATDAFACEQVRAALDIGSGTTKMVVARVDFCQRRVLQVLAPAPGEKLERQVQYDRNRHDDSNGRKVFTHEVIAEGVVAMLELKAVALIQGAEAFSAVATAAFRSVDPAHLERVLGRIRDETGFRVRVIPQEEEARIGYLATSVNVGVPLEDLVVWDIGGGSMQIAYWDEALNAVAGYLGEFANGAMQRFIIEKIQGKDLLTTPSPNPIGTLGVSWAIQEAERVARESVPPRLRAELETPEAVTGIGGVHFFSNCEFLQRFSADGCEFSREELLNQAYRYAHLTDRELVENGLSASVDFAPFRVSSAALTAGFMSALGIDRVRAIEMNMAGGILLDSDFWSTAQPDEHALAALAH